MDRKTVLLISAEARNECGNCGIWDDLVADFKTYFRRQTLCREFLMYLDEVLQ